MNWDAAGLEGKSRAIENALKSTAHKYTNGAPYQTVGPYTSSFDKGTGLVDVVAAATLLGAHTSA